MVWVTVYAHYDLGLLPSFFREDDPRPAREQINERYISGWHPMPGCGLRDGTRYMVYPGDPPAHFRAVTMLREEQIVLYEHDWLAIVQRDGSFEIARID